jgi:hypothetical protein
MALLLKSVQGYAEVLWKGEETMALVALMETLMKIKEEVGNADFLTSLDEGYIEETREKLLVVLNSPDLRGLINPEAIDFIQQSKNPEYAIRETLSGLDDLGKWRIKDNRIFFRPGLLNFPFIARLIGRIADF